MFYTGGCEMKLEDIMNLKVGEIAELSTPLLKEYVEKLASVGNRRLRSLEKANYTNTPAYNAIQRSGGDFTASGKNRRGLMNELQREMQFIKAKTSTVSGAKATENRVNKATNKWFNEAGLGEYTEMDEDDKKEFWKFFKGTSINRALEAYFGNYKGKEAIAVALDIWHGSEEKDIYKMRQQFRRRSERLYRMNQDERQRVLDLLVDTYYQEI